MSKRRISENQRLIGFAMSASEGELNFAVDTLTGIRDSRFPKVAPVKVARRGRGPAKVKVAQPSAPTNAHDATAAVGGE